ncbi:10712_t:CDS:2, partial [Racocetra persica]
MSTILHQRFVNSPLNTLLFKRKFNLAASIPILKQLDIVPVRCHITNSLLNKRNNSYQALNSFNKLPLDGKRRYQTNISNLRKAQRSKNDIIEREKVKEWGDLSAGQKAAKVAKTTTNISVIVIGVGVLGTPIKGHGIPIPNSRLRNPRARLRDVINTDGTPHRIMHFYVEGPLTNGNGLLDMVK